MTLLHALITGVSGQDGALLAAQLLAAGVRVTGTRRPTANIAAWRLKALGIAEHPDFRVLALDVRDADACRRLLLETRADAVFHLAAQSSVAGSFSDPLGSLRDNGLSAANLLEAMRDVVPYARFVLAASAEMLEVEHTPVDESAPLAARSPYALSKLIAHGAVSAWRTTWGIHASSAILFNHESEWRGESFVTRRISQGVARIAIGAQQCLALGNLDAQRDFGYAPDHVSAMSRMAEREQPGDYILASGRATSVREFATFACAAAGITLEWRGHGVEEIAVDTRGTTRIRVDAQRLRPVDAKVLVGNADKARSELGFVNTLDVAAIARRMVEADIARERG